MVFSFFLSLQFRRSIRKSLHPLIEQRKSWQREDFKRIVATGIIAPLPVIALLTIAGLVGAALGFGKYEYAGVFAFFSKNPTMLFYVTGFSLSIAALAGLGLSYLERARERGVSEDEQWDNHVKALYYGILCALVFLLYVHYFSTQIYPLIPYSFGGGKPSKVVFLLRPENRGQVPVVPSGDANRSIPYHMLLATDKTYVVLSPDKGEQSIEFNRDTVLGHVVLRENGEEVVQDSRADK
jgi:hypothetical protein